MKIRILFIIICSLVFCAYTYSHIALSATSNITHIAFTTDEQSLGTDIISDAITIQAQNSEGGEEKLDGTADVIFTSSSATGEFLGSTGKTVTKTMNSGSANKTFYYRDSINGSHTITVHVIPRSGGEGWTAYQKIYIGESVPTLNKNDENRNENNAKGSDSESDIVENFSQKEDSAHSGTSNISTFSKAENIKISAGRTRTVLINTPIFFEAEAYQTSKKALPKMNYKWSYGDGDSDVGEQVKHIYYFPGEYNVVLVASYGKEKITARTQVRVVDNHIVISSSSPGTYGFIELRNNSTSEVNINKWKLSSNGHEYIMSVDTIINARSSIRIPNKVMHFEPVSTVELIFPNGEIAYTYNTSKIGP